MNRPDRWTALAICLSLAGITWLVFGQTFGFDFVNYDDYDYVLKNQHVANGLTRDDLTWAFTHLHASNWHPLTWISHMLDCQLYGLAAWGHHLSNVILHAVTATLLFLLLRAMTGALWRSAFVAALFAIHPLHVESVAWISERKDVLSGLFFVLTLGAYLRYTRKPSRGRYLLLVLAFSLGLMCKPMLVTVPFILLLLDYWPLKRVPHRQRDLPRFYFPGRLLAEKLPLLLLAGALSLITLFAQRGTIAPLDRISIPFRFSNALISCLTYLRQMLYPAGLAVFYPMTEQTVSVFGLIISLLILLAISLLVFVLRSRRYLVVGWLWYLIMLLPVIGLVQVGLQAHADRYTYLPQIGLYLASTWAISELIRSFRYSTLLLTTFGLSVICALLVVAREQTAFWRESETLWTHALACTPENATARGSLAFALYGKGRINEALPQFQRSLELDPGQPKVHSDYGVALLDLGRTRDAISHFQLALQIDPDYVEAYSNLGLALLSLNRLPEALNYFKQALRLQPDFAPAYYNLGNTYLEMGQADAAIESYERAIVIDPRDRQALNNAAWILATWPAETSRDSTKAVAFATRADHLAQSQAAVIHATLAAATAENGRFEEAVKIAEQARSLALGQGNETLAKSIGEQLETYRGGHAFRDDRHQAKSGND